MNGGQMMHNFAPAQQQQNFEPMYNQPNQGGMMMEPNGPSGQVLPQMLQNQNPGDMNQQMHMPHQQMCGPDSLGLDNFNDPLLFND